MRKLPPLTALPAFEATARLGSVSAAAEELGRTHGAVSKQLHNLAEALGVTLFEKEGTGLRLTATGRSYAETIGTALDDIARASREASGAEEEHLVHLGMSSSFANRWLLPRMPDFHQRHPNIKFGFSAGWTHDGKPSVDGVLSWDRLRQDDQGFPSRLVIGDVHLGLVAAPGYPLQEIGPKQIHVARRYVQGLSQETRSAWDSWAEVHGIAVTADETKILPQTGVCIEGAVAGQGVALTERRLVEDELEEGTLEAPLGWWHVPNGFWIFVQDAQNPPPGIRTFITWLQEIDGA